MTYQYITAKKEIITAALEEDNISINIKKSREEKIQTFPYASIKEVILNVQEQRYSMSITFQESDFQLNLNTDSFGKIDPAGNVIRSFIAVSKNDAAAKQRKEEYKLFVCQLHQKLIEKKLGGIITFKFGGKTFITYAFIFAIGLSFWVFPMAISTGQYVPLVILSSLMVKAATMVYKSGWRSKPYNPHAIPTHLLPV